MAYGAEAFMKLENKVAVITGAATGLGFETAKLFFKEGASVVGTYHVKYDKKKVMEAFHDSEKVVYIKTDITSVEEVKHFSSEIEKKFKRVDILINNAAVDTSGNVEDTAEEDFKRIMDVNVYGMFLVTKYIIPLMKKEGKGGSIVNVSSSIGLMGMANRLAYTTSKGAVINFTRSMAMDYVDYNIRVNAIAPGGIFTEMVEEFFKRNTSEEFKKEIFKMHVINRLAQPEEIAKPILFLASDDSSYTNGAVFSVDGGYTCGK
jgi:NAD(P)-dependent dehydrogenase (short-subunit alcohol dehydrogenase family)